MKIFNYFKKRPQVDQSEIDASIKSFSWEGGVARAEMSSEGLQRFGLALATWFRQEDLNVFEMSFSARSEPYEKYTLQIQKTPGKTPMDLHMAEKAKSESLEKQVQLLRDALCLSRTKMGDQDTTFIDEVLKELPIE